MFEKYEDPDINWMEPYESDGVNGATCIVSSRISDADIEGSTADMRRLCTAIEQGAAYESKRCAVSAPNAVGRVLLWSPRNSKVYAAVSTTRALEAAWAFLSKVQE